jgi:hypothetical protein
VYNIDQTSRGTVTNFSMLGVFNVPHCPDAQYRPRLKTVAGVFFRSGSTKTSTRRVNAPRTGISASELFVQSELIVRRLSRRTTF